MASLARPDREHVREPDVVVDAEHTMHAGTPHVGVDQQHPRAAYRQGEREVDAVVVLPSSGWALVTITIRGDRRPAAEHQRRPQRPEGLAELVRHLRERRAAVCRRTFGANPKPGALSFAVTSSGVLTVSSR